MYTYKDYQVDPYTGQIYSKTGKPKTATKCGRAGEYLKISTGRNSSSTVQRVIILAYYGIDALGSFKVHHIDKNPKNNCITNLLVIDDVTHHQLHKLDQSEYTKACHELKKSERSRLKERGLIK